MATIFKAYHGDKAVKEKYLKRMKAHIKADELIRGSCIGWDDKTGKGCAVGCTLNNYSHIGYETELGIPRQLAYLEDWIFERLPIEDSKKWPEQFLSAIKPGADLKYVYYDFMAAMLGDSKMGVLKFIQDVKYEKTKAFVAATVAFFKSHTEPGSKEWNDARDALAALDKTYQWMRDLLLKLLKEA